MGGRGASYAKKAETKYDSVVSGSTYFSNDSRKLFGDYDKMTATELINKGNGELTRDEKNVFYEYTSFKYKAINAAAGTFEGKKFDDMSPMEQCASTMSSVLERHKLGHNVTLYRTFGATSDSEFRNTFGIDINGAMKKLKSGQTVEGRQTGFLSTSTRPDGYDEKKTYNYVISAKKSAKAMYIAPISKYRNEDEVVFQKNTKIKIKKIDVEKDEVFQVRDIYKIHIDID